MATSARTQWMPRTFRRREMACQSNPKTYAIVVRCPLEDGARLKSRAAIATERFDRFDMCSSYEINEVL